MKKAYTITPNKYRENVKLQNNTRWKYGEVKYAPESLRKKCTKAAEENLNVQLPEDELFFENADIYNLWLNRDTDEPITARELYEIVMAIGKSIKDAESNARTAAAWSNWDGHM